MAKRTYKYFAFISYKSDDEEWAVWLQHELEHYHLPTSFIDRSDIRQNLRPVFRDMDELSAGNLPSQLHQALVDSQNLIVICSPKSAASEWVNKEVESFISHGKTESIFPFIIEGNGPEDYFPPALFSLPKDKERLGGDVHKSGKDAAFVKVVAGMLGLDYALLWNRYEKEKAIEERRIREQRDSLFRSQSRFLSEKANTLNAGGNSYMARRLAMVALPVPGDINGRPFVVEAEKALRESCLTDDFKQHLTFLNPKIVRLQAVRGLTLFVIFSPEVVHVCDASSGCLIRTIKKPSRPYFDDHLDSYRDNAFFRSCTISPDGRLLATVNNDCTCRVWDINSGEMLATLGVPFDWDEFEKTFPDYDIHDPTDWEATGMDLGIQSILDAKFSPDGNTLAILSFNCTLWDTNTFTKIGSLYATPFLEWIDFDTSGRYIYCNSGRWDLETSLFSPVLLDTPSLSYYNTDKGVYSIDKTTKRKKLCYKGKENIVCFCHIAEMDTIVVYTENNDLIGRPIHPNKNVSMDVRCPNLCYIAFRYPLVAGILADASESDHHNEIVIFDISQRTERCILRGLTSRADVCSISQHRDLVIASSYNETLVWQIPERNEPGESTVVFPIQDIPLSDCVTAHGIIGKDHKVFYADYDHSFGYVDGKNIVLIENPAENDADDMDFAGKWQKGNEGVYWQRDVWEEELPYYANTIAISPNESIIVATYCDSYLRVWNKKTHALVKKILLDSLDVTATDFSLNGEYLLVVFKSGLLNVFKTGCYERVFCTTLRAGISFMGSFDLSQNRIITCTVISRKKGTAIHSEILEFPTLEKLLEQTHQKFINAEFTAEEKKRYNLE